MTTTKNVFQIRYVLKASLLDIKANLNSQSCMQYTREKLAFLWFLGKFDFCQLKLGMLKLHKIKKLSFGTDKKIIIFIFSIDKTRNSRSGPGRNF